MHLPLNDIIMKDEGENITKIGFYIIHLDDSKGPGTHWTSLYYTHYNQFILIVLDLWHH